ncbi:cysteine peptidase family C39 domain-containing protein [Motiliproteus sp. MSK22-1]|uniref:cysteine peptidase family C39 domain-containing protein n=1 Tax=Motiliproteus sp. MSK22-1 TaxID=1897630 RepID=UPI001301599C|nr:cysteine peptidase family C39 domain-containing protein [Motiliproteus sp. MSK22-1]
MDVGLSCLVIIARFLQMAVDGVQLTHHFASHEKSVDSNDLVRAARHLKLKSRSSTVQFQQLEKIVFPAILQDKEEAYFLLARVAEEKEYGLGVMNLRLVFTPLTLPNRKLYYCIPENNLWGI